MTNRQGSIRGPEVTISWNREAKVIEFNRKGQWIYEVDLDRCANSKQAIGWIRQVAQKSWADTELVTALCTLLIEAMSLDPERGI